MILVVPSGGTLNFTVMLDVFSTGTGTLITTISDPTSTFPSVILTTKGVSGALTQRTLTLGTLLTNATSAFTAGGILGIAPPGTFRIDFTASGATQELWIKGVDTTNGWETEKVAWQQLDSASDYMGAPAGMATTQNQATLLAAINALVPSTIPGAYIGNFTIQDNSSNPIQAAIIRLSLNGVPQGSFTTDANGNATTSIDNRVYTIAATYPGFSFTPTTFNAGTGGSFTFHMTRLTPAAAPSASECRIQDYLTDQSGNPLGGATIAWYLQNPDIHTGIRNGTISSDATSGYYYLDVQQGTGPYILDRSRIANVIFPQITVTALNTTGSSYIST